MPTQLQTLGLFPLPAVLLPGAALGLRVFEPRYLDLSQLTVDADGTPYRISRGIADGAYGLFIADPKLQTILHPELLAVLELEAEEAER